MTSEPDGMGRCKARRLGEIDRTENDTDGFVLPVVLLDSPLRAPRAAARNASSGADHECAERVTARTPVPSATSRIVTGLFLRTSLYCTKYDIGSHSTPRLCRRNRICRAKRTARGHSDFLCQPAGPYGIASASSNWIDRLQSHARMISVVALGVAMALGVFRRRFACPVPAPC